MSTKKAQPANQDKPDQVLQTVSPEVLDKLCATAPPPIDKSLDYAEQRRYVMLKHLRDPFNDTQISLLPKPTCSAEEYKKLPRGKCAVCGGYHATSNTIHLDYVGHAAVTDRLLAVDPEWNWEPVAVDASGAPALDKDGGMWIKLTILGVTRLGYGDAQGKTGHNATKERIGDAIRNAAMRFGVAIELWHKGELKRAEIEDGEASTNSSAKPEIVMPAAKEKNAVTTTAETKEEPIKLSDDPPAEHGEVMFISKKLAALKQTDPDSVIQAAGLTGLDNLTKSGFAALQAALKGKK